MKIHNLLRMDAGRVFDPMERISHGSVVMQDILQYAMSIPWEVASFNPMILEMMALIGRA